MKRSLRVAVLAACPFPSHQGTQVFVRHLADAQSRYGHEIELFSYGYGDRGEQTNWRLQRVNNQKDRPRIWIRNKRLDKGIRKENSSMSCEVQLEKPLRLLEMVGSHLLEE